MKVLDPVRASGLLLEFARLVSQRGIGQLSTFRKHDPDDDVDQRLRKLARARGGTELGRSASKIPRWDD